MCRLASPARPPYLVNQSHSRFNSCFTFNFISSVKIPPFAERRGVTGRVSHVLL